MDFNANIFIWQLMVTALIILCTISGFIGYYSKDKSFQFYALYSFFLCLYFLTNQEFRPLRFASGNFSSLRWYIQVVYNCSYFLFFLYFLDIKEHIYRFYKFIYKAVLTIGLIATGVYIYTLLIKSPILFEAFYIYIFVPIIFCLAVYTLYKAIFLPGKLKYFAITGGGIFIIFAMMALFFPILKISFYKASSYNLFYIGIFFEQIIFAIGLGYKIRIINQHLFEKSKEIQHIREKQNRILINQLKQKEEEILAMRLKAEEERIAQIRSKYMDQISRLHLLALQNQMNPHFIFNALNSIKVFLIENDKEKGVYYLNKFSKLIRHILESSRGESISLEEEMEMMKLYMSIENIRFDSKIKFSIQNPEKIDLTQIFIPPMISQPFIENAIWHGLSAKKEGSRNISIRFSSKAHTVFMKIRDNGIGREESQKKSQKQTFQKKSFGLKIVSERIKYFNEKMAVNYTYSIHDLLNKNGEVKGTEIVFVLQNIYDQ